MAEQNSEFAHNIAQEIRTAVDGEELDLPTLPEVALRIRDEAESTCQCGLSGGGGQ